MSEEFEEGQMVICINENFDKKRLFFFKKKKKKNKLAPYLGEVLIIEDLIETSMGAFFSFEKFNEEDGNTQWWHQSRFQALNGTTEEELEGAFNQIIKDIS